MDKETAQNEIKLLAKKLQTSGYEGAALILTFARFSLQLPDDYEMAKDLLVPAVPWINKASEHCGNKITISPEDSQWPDLIDGQP